VQCCRLKIRHLCTITQLCPAISSQLRHVPMEKNLLNSNISPICPHHIVNFGPLAAKIGSLVWGMPANLIGFHVLSLLLQRHRSTSANQTLHDVWLSPGLVHYINIFGGSCLITKFPQCKIHFASKSCALVYWQHYYTALE